jgi:hypothetical protein
MKSGDAIKTAKLLKEIMNMKRLSWSEIDQAYNA